ncbi:MAG TPA: DUF2193 family protein, partial [Methanocorpusculum sp.]|nr:DUF2193 family protein [Methanocorpusculum sp.]
MKNLYRKMVEEALAAQYADIDVIRRRRGMRFHMKDTKPYVDAVEKMTVLPNQSKAVINLHKESVKNHFEVLSTLTTHVREEDDPFVEHYQTPVVLDIICSEDEAFAGSMEKFAD